MNITYSTFSSRVQPHSAALVDRGANGGIAGSDVVLLEETMRRCNVSGIDDHTMTGLKVGTCAALADTNVGKVILVLHQYAYSGKGRTIHSSAQLEAFGSTVDDRSKKFGGKQMIVTSDGIIIPIHIRQGLPYIDMTKPTVQDLETYKKVILTSDVEWVPASIDNEGNFDSTGSDIMVSATALATECAIDDLWRRAFKASMNAPVTHEDFIDDLVDVYSSNEHKVSVTKPHYEVLQPNFAYAPVNVIQKTFECTTQWAKLNERYPFRKHFKSRFPALNVTRRNETVATDTIFGTVPALGNRCTIAQIFVGRNTFLVDVYPMRTEADFVYALQDNIRHRGAMSKLASDMAQVEISERVKDVLRMYHIDDYQSEPYHEHQNPAERRYQTLKRYTNTILERTGAPANTWLLVMQYAAAVLNLTWVESINMTPLQKLTGQTPDISILLPFKFWEPVYFATGDALSYSGHVSFPAETAENVGRIVGFGTGVGDALTFKVLTDKTQRVLYRSSVRSAITTPPNLRLQLPSDDTSNVPPVTPPQAIDLQPSGGEREYRDENVDNIDTDDTLYSVPEPGDYQTIISINGLPPDNEYDVVDNNGNGGNNDVIEDTNMPTLPTLQEEELQFAEDSLGPTRDNNDIDVVVYNDILDRQEQDYDNNKEPVELLLKFENIIGHEGPLHRSSPGYMGSRYNVIVKWVDGTKSHEPLNSMAVDDPVSCAQYAKDKGLLEQRGWKRFKPYVAAELRISKAKTKFSTVPTFKFGYLVPKTVKDAMRFDEVNKDGKWKKAIRDELDQINEYKTFINLGKDKPAPPGFKRIRVHFVFDVKHDARHKARLVAGGHLTDEPTESIYSGVVSLRSLRLAIFAGELNGLSVWGADVGNAYLESYTKEKVYIVAGPEFGEQEGCTLIINKALYGLRSSGLRWHERLADTLRDMEFRQCKADADVWMRKNVDTYEYIAVYVDDLAIVAKDPKSITDTLTIKYKYRLKGVGPIDYHLGGNFGRDQDGTLRYGPRKYIDKLVMAYEKMYGTKPKEYQSPLEKGDHPELDNSEELDEEGITQYQSMMGALQWSVSLGRFDILAAVMTLSRFRIAPRQGHLDRLKRIYGYLKRFSNGDIRFRTGLPDYDELVPEEYDWAHTVYGQYYEDLPDDAPMPLGNPVITTTYVDANLQHCMITGRSSSGILHLVNGTPIDWYSKRQNTVELATYGSEFIAARIATDQIVDLRLTLKYLGLPVLRSVLFGDNQSVVTSGTVPHSKLNKRHTALSYHRIREAIAKGILEFYHINGVDNPADMLSKHAGYPQFWGMLRSLLFWGVNVPHQGDEQKESNFFLRDYGE